jgi:hypothetical protein
MFLFIINQGGQVMSNLFETMGIEKQNKTPNEILGKLARAYPGDNTITELNEFVASVKRNIYFNMEGLENTTQLMAKVIAYFSRSALKGERKPIRDKMLDGNNAILGRDFTEEQWECIYTIFG